MFAADQIALASALLEQCRQKKLTLATAESCTGGLVSGLLTAVAGASDVFLAGYVTYSNAAKVAILGVSPSLIQTRGAVSEDVAMAMAEGACRVAASDVAMAVTGIAGPAGGTAEKPVGLVHVAAARAGLAIMHRRLDLGPRSREEIRMLSVTAAIELGLAQALAPP
jgi:nicotinamide-nucleotide amidase